MEDRAFGEFNSRINFASTISNRAVERIDLMLLALESIDVNASQEIINTTIKLGLQDHFPNNVALWMTRCSNPLRKCSTRIKLENKTTEAMILILSELADQFYPRIRQLLSNKEPATQNTLRWNCCHQRMNELIEERMNLSRGAVKKYLNYETIDFYRDIIFALALSSGPGGAIRLRASLLDSKNP